MNFTEVLLWAVIANAVLLLLQTIRVISVYSAVYTLSPKDWRRQLPLHVWLMATAFFIYVGGTTWFLLVGAGHELSRGIIYGTGGLIAQYALWNILKYDRRRYSAATNFQDPHIALENDNGT